MNVFARSFSRVPIVGPPETFVHPGLHVDPMVYASFSWTQPGIGPAHISAGNTHLQKLIVDLVTFPQIFDHWPAPPSHASRMKTKLKITIVLQLA